MATLSHALRHVKQHLDLLVPDWQIFLLCAQCKHVWRDRLLDPAVTVQLFLLQLLSKVALNGLRRAAALNVSAAAICKARQRLPLEVLRQLVFRSAPKKVVSTWKGLILYLVDGTVFKTPDTPALARRHGKSANQRGLSNSYPRPKLLALMDYAGGFIHKVIPLPASRQEYTCLSRLFKAMAANALLLGDRGLVSFVHLAMMINAGIEGCFRLPRDKVIFPRGDKKKNKRRKNKRASHNRAGRRMIKRLGRQDRLVRWVAYRCPLWLSARRWKTLAEKELTLRQISFRVCRRGYRTHWAWIITTLIDPVKYPPEQLIELYSRRWQIEVYFRDMKKTLGMEMISAKTVQGVQKEMLAFVLLYNIIRRIMSQAAQTQGTTADRISFIDALNWLLWSDPGEPIPILKVNPVRTRKAPARKVKDARHRFGQLNQTREQSNKPPCCVVL